MVQIISPESVARLSRKDLKLPEWSDTIVIDQLAKLFGKVSTDLTADDVAMDVVMQRFAWLVAKAEQSGFGVTPGLFMGNGVEINRDYVADLAKARGYDIVKAASEVAQIVELRVDQLQRNLEELKRLASTVRYEPADDEPTIFGNQSSGQPGTEWLLWHSKKFGIGIVQAHDVACMIIMDLERELPRTVNRNTAPDKFITDPEFKSAGINRMVLSMKWVVHHKYMTQLSWFEAHLAGTAVTVHHA